MVPDKSTLERLRIDRAEGSADETADVGGDLSTPVVDAIGSEKASRFSGDIESVTIEVGEMNPADRAAEAAARKEHALRRAASD